MRTIIEPFRIKVVEPIRETTPAQRRDALRAAHYNVFGLAARDVLIDLLTDSGTGAMSQNQWAGIMRGDESYAGSESFFRLREVVEDLFGMPAVIPTHQGRASERILFSLVGGEGKVIPNNTHFDTTRANIEFSGAEAVDLPSPTSRDTQAYAPFKGDMDTRALQALIDEVGAERIPLIVLTLTNNAGGGQPVSMANIREVHAIARRHGIPLWFDACRFAENAWFIRQREDGYADRSIEDIVREMFSYADGFLISAKKDGLVNIGGLLAMRDARLAAEARNLLILTEGFPTYGGLAGRDLEAMAQGFREVVDPHYLRYRIRSTAYVAEHLRDAGVPVLWPPGGHAVYVDAGRFLDHIPAEQFPGQSLVVAMYVHAGIRACEMGSVMFGEAAGNPHGPEAHHGPTGRTLPELVRLAIPRRVYTQSHMDYVVEALGELREVRHRLPGYRITWQPERLRHFTCHFEPVGNPQPLEGMPLW